MASTTTIALLAIAATASVLFTALYGLRSAWFKSYVGRMQFTKSISLSAVLVMMLLNLLFGPYPYQAVVRNIVYGVLAVVLWAQVGLLLWIQHYPPTINYGRRADDVCKKREHVRSPSCQ